MTSITDFCWWLGLHAAWLPFAVLGITAIAAAAIATWNPEGQE